ncbi:hypothetical protein JKF63_00483 [Porcisia hertigi]|uniref:Uncharacterized protein n=1 Tax=Porcisia hertigi TaxID=2761500 RepID=A0A836I9N0_9TRYP|nr:hypothetical protein JKF63_00483 [Porcisia hertigi]
MLQSTAQQFKSNALFRVLAFLDNTGVQTFTLNSEVDADGRFRDPDTVFAAEAPITGVLSAALDALRANVRRLFTDAAEQHALLSALGAGAPGQPVKESLSIARASTPLPVEEKDVAPASLGSVRSSQQQQSFSTPLSPTPASTPWCELVLHPTSLAHYADDVEKEFPIHLMVRLHEVLGISAGPSFCCTSSAFIEQFLVDGIDEWLRRCPIEEVKRMVLACGVQPTVLASAFTQEQQQAAIPQDTALPNALADFVVDVVFPVPGKAAEESPNVSCTEAMETLEDWLILSYEKNHEALDIEEIEDAVTDGQSDDSDNNGGHLQSERKRPRADNTCAVANNSLGSWHPVDGEEVLTAENIDRYLRECPQRIPKSILREKRKRISDASITEFELEHHYTAAELKKLVKGGLGVMTASEATSFMECPVTETQVKQAALLTRKSQFVAWILSVHHKSLTQEHTCEKGTDTTAPSPSR